jgi:hypothetical protein
MRLAPHGPVNRIVVTIIPTAYLGIGGGMADLIFR